ncbi:CHAD domain-containing protein [Comamonas phosphati]|nr:CHAD domain-containing protein [Comamonas phosphati]
MGKGKTSRRKLSAETALAGLAFPLVDSAIEQAREIAREPSVEGLHQLRTTMRSLQSLWWFYRPLTGAGEYTQRRSTFKSIANAAGRARDYDILLEMLRLRKQNTAVLAPEIQAIREAAMEAGRGVLSPLGMQALLRQTLWQTSASLAARQNQRPLRAFADARVAKSERQLRKLIEQAVRAKKPDFAAFHDVRKAGKKTRYLLELLGPVLSGNHQKTLARLKKSLKSLGDLNDVVASERLLLENPSLLSAIGKPGKVCHWFEKERQRRLSASAYLLRKDWR